VILEEPRVLVVYKKDAYRRYILEQRDARLRRLLQQGQRDVVDMRRSHRIHEASLKRVLEVLRSLSVRVDVAYRAHLKVKRRYELVVCVGGDGTFLEAAREVNVPILGVNANPSRSEAVFCASTAENFPKWIHQALEGRLPVLRLPRLQASLNGRKLKPLALNDMLIVHDHPATTSRYRMHIGSSEEFQKSSGVWVATAAGSGSAVLAAGGKRLAWSSRRFQYRPRELYRGRLSKCRLTGGTLTEGRSVGLTWLMRKGSIYVDGPHVRIPLRYADRVEIRPLFSNPTQVLGLRGSRKQIA